MQSLWATDNNQRMAQRTVAPKEIIFREGETGDFAYILQSGKVEILKHAEHGEVSLAVLEEGAVFGEMALFDFNDVRSASARALETSVLEVLSAEEFQMLLAKCPGHLLPFLRTMIDRLRSLNRRIAASERATVLLDADINHLTISPDSPALEGVFAPITVEAANLPFSIGGYLKGDEPHHNNSLSIPCTSAPPMISYEHCVIERHPDGVYLVDAGSRFCTSVNGKYIGRAKVSNKALLVPGENKIVLGDHTSPYHLKIMCA